VGRVEASEKLFFLPKNFIQCTACSVSDSHPNLAAVRGNAPAVTVYENPAIRLSSNHFDLFSFYVHALRQLNREFAR
jgi:hypothetical protein